MSLIRGTYSLPIAWVIFFSLSLYARCLLASPDSVPEIDGDEAQSIGELSSYKTMNNAALDRLEPVSARFNRELRKFKHRKSD